MTERDCIECRSSGPCQFNTHCVHCDTIISPHVEYIACDVCKDNYAICTKCRRSGEIFHEHDQFDEYEHGNPVLTLMMTYTSGRKGYIDSCDSDDEPETVIEERMKSRIGSCIMCQKTTSNRCKRCKVNYCSKECQYRDWSRHKQYCIQRCKEMGLVY